MSARHIIAAAHFIGPYRSHGGCVAIHIPEFGRLDVAFACEDDAFEGIKAASEGARLSQIEAETLNSAVFRALDVARAVLAIDS